MQYYSHKDKLKLNISKNVFQPTGTSELLIKNSINYIKNKKKFLDLGCGSGFIGVSIAKKKKKNLNYFSDISKSACTCTIKNLRLNKINGIVRQGSIFDPWKGEKFDYIVCDIAAVAEKISEFSPWYKNCENNSGYDGTNHIVNVLKKSKKYLNPKGKLFFPIISLSNEKKILNIAKRNFLNLKKISSKEWPLPNTMYSKKRTLYKLKKNKIINFQEKLSIIIFKTDIYMVSN
jgi:ribosomal protein L11 methylase PrmA